MAENNNIISFTNAQKKRKKAGYKLNSEISIHICRVGETYNIQWFSRDEKQTQEDIYLILQAIFRDLLEEVGELEIKRFDNYEVNFILLYYENESNRQDFKYIYTPREMKKEKLAEYLFTCISIHELKKIGAL